VAGSCEYGDEPSRSGAKELGIYDALWKQCTETKHRSHIHGMMYTCTSIEGSKQMFKC
jgi:hypothetical protein